jgi:hypothetical protein
VPERERARLIDPLAARGDGDAGPFPLDLNERSLLAQGDSWFSLGALPPTRTTRVLAALRLPRGTVISNCARPGAVLHRMTDTTTAQFFPRLPAGPRALHWDAVLLSGGGDDLIDAVGAGPEHTPQQRILRTPAKRGPNPAGGADHVGEAGRTTFLEHIRVVFDRFVDTRNGGIEHTTPIVWHDCARVTPTRVGAGAGFGPWLPPSLERFQVPQSDRRKVSDEWIARLGVLVRDLADVHRARDPPCGIHIADSQSARLLPADADATGASGARAAASQSSAAAASSSGKSTLVNPSRVRSVIRVGYSRPIRWSHSCCTTRAWKPSASRSSGRPWGSRPR